MTEKEYKKFMSKRNKELRAMTPEQKAQMKLHSDRRNQSYDYDELKKYMEARIISAIPIQEEANEYKENIRRLAIVNLAERKIEFLRKKHKLPTSCLCTISESCSECDDGIFIKTYPAIWAEALEMAINEQKQDKSELGWY